MQAADNVTVGSGGGGARREDSAISLGVLSTVGEIKTTQSLQPKPTDSKMPVVVKRLGASSMVKVNKASNQRVEQKPTPLSNTQSSNASIILSQQSKKASLLSPSSVDQAKKAYNSKPVIGRYQLPNTLKPPTAQ